MADQKKKQEKSVFTAKTTKQKYVHILIALEI